MRVFSRMFEIGGWAVTQAMVIAVLLMLVGAVGLAMTWKRRAPESVEA